MPLNEAVALRIASAVVGLLIRESGLEGAIRERLGRDPVRLAFAEALQRAENDFRIEHPELSAALFDESFLEHEAAPILAELLKRDGRPDAVTLARRWTESLNATAGEATTTLVRDVEKPAADFLTSLARELAQEEALTEINDARAVERIAKASEAISDRMEANVATPGDRLDYLAWIISRNSYIDPRGIPQTQRQVQLPLDDVYVSLSGRLEEASTAVVDRPLSGSESTGPVAPRVAGPGRHPVKVAATGDEETALTTAVAQFPFLVVLGDPGAGKTTLIRYLALTNAKALYAGQSSTEELGPARLPIPLRIAEYAADHDWRRKSLTDFLAESQHLHECPANSLPDLLARELSAGHCLVLLDGLDEVVANDDRVGVVQRIEEFVARYSAAGNRFVVTSRVANYRTAPLGEPFIHYRVRDMSEAQIARFLERWCPAVELAQTPDLPERERLVTAQREIDGISRAIQQSPGVRRLAANPLLLTILALIHRTGAALPQKRIELYKTAAETLARTWRTAQGVPESVLVEAGHLVRLLGRVGYWLHTTHATGIADERDLRSVLGEEWARISNEIWDPDAPDPGVAADVEEFLTTVRVHTGLLLERATRHYGFMHLTFEEYYAARHLVARRRDAAKLIRAHLHDPRWDEPILLAIGFVGLDYPEEASDLVEGAILGLDGPVGPASAAEDVLARDFIFALRCLGDQIPVERGLQEQLVGRVLRELVAYEGPARFLPYRDQLGERLDRLSATDAGQQLLDELATAMSDDDPVVRKRVAEAFGHFAVLSESSARALTSALADDDVPTRMLAATSLGRTRQEQLAAGVVRSIAELLDHDDIGVRRAAATVLALAHTPDERAVDLLVDASVDPTLNEEDEFPSERWQYALALRQAKVSEPWFVGKLVRVLGDAHLTPFRYLLGERLKALSQESEDCLATLARMMHEAPPELKARLLSILWAVRAPSPDELELFAALLNSEEHDALVAGLAATDALEADVAAAFTERFHQLLTHEAATVRLSAALKLLELGDESRAIVRAQIEGVTTANAAGDYSAVRMPNRGSGLRPVLFEIIEDPGEEEAVRLEAISVLSLSGTLTAGEADRLAEVFNDPSPKVRAAAADGAASSLDASPAVRAATITLLSDKEPFPRATAAGAFVRSDDLPREAAAAQIELLGDGDPTTRRRAAVSLLSHGFESREIVEQAIDALERSKSWDDRAEAAEALGVVSEHVEVALNPLTSALRDVDFDVAFQAARSLAQLGYRTASTREAVEKCLRDAMESDAFADVNPDSRRSGQDMAWEALMMLVSGTTD